MKTTRKTIGTRIRTAREATGANQEIRLLELFRQIGKDDREMILRITSLVADSPKRPIRKQKIDSQKERPCSTKK